MKTPSIDVEAKWTYAIIGAGIDIGISVERMIEILSKENIVNVANIIKEKENE